jgi:superfamily II DNA helicase RecQ
VVSEKQVAEAILAQFEQVPRDWQLEAGLQMLRGEDLMLVARTAAGKSMVFKIVAMAARLAGLHGCVIVICPLKEVEKDQVRKQVNRMQMCTHKVLHE